MSPVSRGLAERPLLERTWSARTRLRTCSGLFTLLGLLAFSRPGEARAEGVVPVVTLGGRVHGDRVRVVLASGEELGRDERATPVLELGLGLAIPAPSAWLPTGSLTLVPHLGLELGLVRGDGRLAIGGEAAWTFYRAGPLALSTGLGLGAHLGLAHPASSAVELALLVAVRLGPVELTWRPTLALPIAANDDPVFGGTRTQAVEPGLAPAALVLTVYLEIL